MVCDGTEQTKSSFSSDNNTNVRTTRALRAQHPRNGSYALRPCDLGIDLVPEWCSARLFVLETRVSFRSLSRLLYIGSSPRPSRSPLYHSAHSSSQLSTAAAFTSILTIVFYCSSPVYKSCSRVSNIILPSKYHLPLCSRNMFNSFDSSSSHSRDLEFALSLSQSHF